MSKKNKNYCKSNIIKAYQEEQKKAGISII